MKRTAAAFLLIVGVVFFGCVVSYAQEVHKVVANVPNAFTVGGNQLPAGTYEFSIPGIIHKQVDVRSLDGKLTATGLIITGIASDPQKTSEARLVFDVFGGLYILAEAWFPGHEGFLIAGFKNDTEHHHSVVHAAPPKP